MSNVQEQYSDKDHIHTEWEIAYHRSDRIHLFLQYASDKRTNDKRRNATWRETLCSRSYMSTHYSYFGRINSNIDKRRS